MKTKHWLVLIITFTFTLMFLHPVCAEAKTLRLNYSMPKGASIAASWDWFAEELGKRSDDKLTVKIFPLGALFKIKAARDNIIEGTADITNLSVLTEATRMPLSSVVMLPNVSWPYTKQGILDAGNGFKQLIKESPALAKEWRDFKVVAFCMLNRYHIISKKPVLWPTDIKGMKIKSGGIQGKLIKSLGGGQVSLSPPKSYMSLKTGVIDGGAMSFSQMYDYKLWEVATNVTNVDLGRVLLPLVMNKDSWNSLSPSEQKLFDSLTEEMLDRGAESMTVDMKKGWDAMSQKGTIHELTPAQEKAWDEAKSKMQAMWIADCKKKGVGDAALKLAKRWKELAEAAN